MAKKHIWAACAVVGAALLLVGYGLQADEFTDKDVERWLGLVSDANPGVRLSALIELEGNREERVTEKVREALADSDSVVRAQAAKMAGERMDIGALPALVGLLSDANTRVRFIAYRALVAIAEMDFGYDPTDPEEERLDGILKRICPS